MKRKRNRRSTPGLTWTQVRPGLHRSNRFIPGAYYELRRKDAWEIVLHRPQDKRRIVMGKKDSLDDAKKAAKKDSRQVYDFYDAGLEAARERNPKTPGYKRPDYQGTPGRSQVLSFGGGVDSMCMLLDAMQRKQLPDVVVFMDVGDPDRVDPAEWPETYTYMTEVVKPLLDKLGVKFVWITSKMYPIRDARSLYQWFKDRGQVPLSGPAHLCSVVAKVERFEKWMQDYFEPGEKIDVWIGFAKGEERRAKRDPHGKKSDTKKKKLKKGEKRPVERKNRFPLMEEELTRDDCKELIAAAGYEVPRKSACVFCPYGEKSEWQDFAKRLPEQFRKIVGMEREKDLTAKGYKIYIHQFKKFGLTPAQYRVMQGISQGRTQFKGSEKVTVKALKERSWVDAEGDLTSYGMAILEEAGPAWKGPPLSPKTGKPTKDDPDLVERAAIGGCVRWTELETEEEGWPSLSTYRVLRAIDEGTTDQLKGAVKGAYTRLKKKSPLVTKAGDLSAEGRRTLTDLGTTYLGPPKKRTCAEYERKPILGIHYIGTAVESYAGFEEGDHCTVTTEEDALNEGFAGNIVPVSRLRVRRGEQAALFNPGSSRYEALKRRLMR